jgi:hypothetical protein
MSYGIPVSRYLMDSTHLLTRKLDRGLLPYRTFNDWRAFTADLLSKTISGNPKQTEQRTRDSVQYAVNQVMDLVTPWCVKDDRDALRGYKDTLEETFLDAVQLAKFLRCQRALWSIRFPSQLSLATFPETGPLMFDPTSMKDHDADDEEMRVDNIKQRYVDIVVSPALYKRGNANGDRFDREEATVPAVVILMPSEELSID